MENDMAYFDSYIEKYGLKSSHIYLLELIPIIEMIWADGQNQENELKLLYRFTVEHLSRVTEGSGSLEVISEEDINDFLAKFTERPPEPVMLKELRHLSLERLNRKPHDEREQTVNEIMNYCMDVAAACVSSYPYKFDERIVKQEKALLKELFAALQAG